MNRGLPLTLLVLSLLALGATANAVAQERKAYRHVDAKGNVTYSQMPPVDGKDVKPVDVSPAQQGRGGYVDGYGAYDTPRHYPDLYDRYATSMSNKSSREARIDVLKAECERQRGTDCNNPRTLQYLDSTHIPRQGVVVRRPNHYR